MLACGSSLRAHNKVEDFKEKIKFYDIVHTSGKCEGSERNSAMQCGAVLCVIIVSWAFLSGRFYIVLSDLWCLGMR